jgi:uridine kinase
MMTITEIASSIKSGVTATKPTLIGVEGFGGSGKTTFAQKLKETLGNAYVVNIDDFIVKEKATDPSWDNGGFFDRKRLERQVLIPAKTGKPVRYEELLWETNTLSQPKIVPEVDYLIVEGISCYHPNIAHYYDYKIWIDTPIEIANQRGRARAGSSENAKHWDLWTENDLRYQKKYHPEQLADFIFSNEAPLSPVDLPAA